MSTNEDTPLDFVFRRIFGAPIETEVKITRVTWPQGGEENVAWYINNNFMGQDEYIAFLEEALNAAKKNRSFMKLGNITLPVEGEPVFKHHLKDLHE